MKYAYGDGVLETLEGRARWTYVWMKNRSYRRVAKGGDELRRAVSRGQYRRELATGVSTKFNGVTLDSCSYSYDALSRPMTRNSDAFGYNERSEVVSAQIGTNQFGSDCITYEGTGSTKKWERLESYGPKFVENIVQATSRDILCYAMQTLSHCFITMHIHDELVIEADPRMSLQAVCDQMGRTPPWAEGLQLRADGYETTFYRKD